MSSSTSLKNTSHEVSGQIIAVNKPQENEHSSDVMYIQQDYLSFKKYIKLIEKGNGKLNGGASMS